MGKQPPLPGSRAKDVMCKRWDTPLITLTANPAWTSRVAKLIQYDPVASMTTRTWLGTEPVAWSCCRRLV